MLVMAATIGACAPNANDDGGPTRPIAVGELVPALTVRTLDGDSARIAPGQPITLLYVWATWCGPCRVEFREIEALQREFGPRGLRVIAVSVDEGDDDLVGLFAREWGATFAIGRDPKRAVARIHRDLRVPESYLISADGRLVAVHGGTLSMDDLRSAIEHALGPVPKPPPSRDVPRASA